MRVRMCIQIFESVHLARGEILVIVCRQEKEEREPFDSSKIAGYISYLFVSYSDDIDFSSSRKEKI